MNQKPSVVIATEQDEVFEEARFSHLNKEGFIRAVNAQDQWYLFINEAWKESKLPANDLIKGYLANMLWRFSERTDLFEKLESYEHLLYLLGIQKADWRYLMDFADRCLQYVAFFPERSGNRHQPRTLDHVAEMGVGAYHDLVRLSVGKDDIFSCSYREMSRSFGLAVMVLRSGCPRFAYQRVQMDENKSGFTKFQLAMQNTVVTEERRREKENLAARFYISENILNSKNN